MEDRSSLDTTVSTVSEMLKTEVSSSRLSLLSSSPELKDLLETSVETVKADRSTGVLPPMDLVSISVNKSMLSVAIETFTPKALSETSVLEAMSPRRTKASPAKVLLETSVALSMFRVLRFRDEVMDLLAYVLADHNVDKPAASE